jgi:hypothetical protein
VQALEAAALRKLIDGQPLNGRLDQLSPEIQEIARAIQAAPPSPDLRTRAFEAAIANRPDGEMIRRAIFEADPGADLEALQPEPLSVDSVPELPEGARLDPALGKGAGAWLDTYTNYAKAISPMTPRTFHESAGLWLAAVAIARRLVLPMAFDEIYPNLFISWIAHTTLYRKSTALNVTRSVARDAFPHLLAPQDTTPEAFLSDLAGLQPANLAQLSLFEQENWTAERNFAAQRGWVLDEMSGLMAGAGKDYNAGLLEACLRFYDCDPVYTRSTRNQGRVVVRNSCLSLLGASTPAALSFHMTAERLWGMGWWARFALLTPEPERPAWRDAIETPRPKAIVDGLLSLYDRLPAAQWPEQTKAQTVHLGAGVFDHWNRYNKALSCDLLTEELPGQLWGSYGRLPTMALKVAMILAALDWQPETPCKIELPHLARALEITEAWRASAHRAIETANANEVDVIFKRIMRQLAKHPSGATVRDIYRFIKDKSPAVIEAALGEMVLAGLIEESEPEQGKRGRPVKRFALIRD